MATRKWGSEVLVNTSLAGNQLNAEVAALAGGGFVVVWQDDSSGDSAILAQLYDALGNPTGGEMVIAAVAGIDFQLPDVTALADGSFYVTATQLVGPDNYIVGSVWDASGALVRSQPVVYAFGQDTNASVAQLGTGSVVAWEDPDGVGTDILLRIFDAAGNGGALIGANTATAAYQLRPSVAAATDASKFAVVWASNADFTIKGRLFTPAGAEFAPEFQIASAAGSLGVDDPMVAWLNNGEFAVIWREFNSYNAGSNQIMVKIFDGQSATANALTGNILVNSISFDSQQSPQITALPNGGFAVSWEDWSGVGGTSGPVVRLQAFDGAGGKIGGEFLVNTTATSVQPDPSITALADGRIVVSWTDNSSGTTDIRMQIVDPRDGIVTGSDAADTLYGNASVNDEISGLAGNDQLFGLAGTDQLYGGAGNDTLSGGKGDDVLYGGDGNDLLLGGAGDDDLFGEGGNDTLTGNAGADAMNGGAGNDTASYFSSKSSVVASLDGTLAGTGDAAGDTFALVENLTGANLAGIGDTLRGNAGGNTLSGFLGNDTLDGGAGNDTLIGGRGADQLTGGLGNDKFQYLSPLDGGDTITDFSNVAGNNDLFQFKASAFGGGLVAATPLLATQFQSSASDVALTTDVRFFYETDTGILRFDADGAAGASAPVIIATLQASLTLTSADIVIF